MRQAIDHLQTLMRNTGPLISMLDNLRSSVWEISKKVDKLDTNNQPQRPTTRVPQWNPDGEP